MKTTHPHTFEIEIDRKEYFRLKAREFRLIAAMIVGFPAFFTGMAVFGSLADKADHWLPVVGAFLAIATSGFFLCWSLSWLYHFAHGSKLAEKQTSKFQVFVEGPFLRIIEAHHDIKKHFRDIHDYTVDYRMHPRAPGVASIILNLPCGKNQSGLRIPAVANGLKTRDLLAQIDADRE